MTGNMKVRKRDILKFAGIVGAVSLAGCAEDDPEENGLDEEDPEPEGGSLTVIVRTEEGDQGDPIEDATVTITGGDIDAGQHETDADGKVSLDGLDPDTYRIEIEADGFESDEHEVPVEEELDWEYPITLSEEE